MTSVSRLQLPKDPRNADSSNTMKIMCAQSRGWKPPRRWFSRLKNPNALAPQWTSFGKRCAQYLKIHVCHWQETTGPKIDISPCWGCSKMNSFSILFYYHEDSWVYLIECPPKCLAALSVQCQQSALNSTLECHVDKNRKKFCTLSILRDGNRLQLDVQ